MGPVLTPKAQPSDPLSLAVDRYLWTGDESAIEEVVAATRPRLLRAASRIVSAHDAEDAVQTAYLSLLRHRGHALGAPVLPWLLTTVVRTAYRRKAAVRRDAHLAERLALPSVDEADPRADAEALARLRSEVTRLPPRYRDAAILHHHLGLSTAEVARLLDVSEPAVRVRLHRARALVRSRWSPRLLASACAIPWFLVDRARDAGAGTGTLVVGGSMNVAAATALAVLAAAGGAVLGRTLLAPAPVTVVDDERALRAEARLKDLEEQLASHKAREDARLAPAPVALATGPKGGDAAAMDGGPAMQDPAADAAAKAAEEEAKRDATAKAKAPRVVVAGHEQLLAAVDWGAIGTNMGAMTPLISKFAQRFAQDGSMDPEVIGKIGVYNGPLMTAALTAGQLLKLEANTAFTHPAFMVNAIVATLEAGKVPASDAQVSSLGELAGRYASELARLPSATNPEAWALARLTDESELRGRFFADAFRLLTPEQLAILTPPEAKDRLQMDIFSPGLMWLTHVQALPFQAREDFVALFEVSMSQHLRIDAAQKSAFHEVVVEWAAGLPNAWFEGEHDPLDSKGFVRVGRVHEAARKTVTLLERWSDRVRPDEAGMARLRGVSVTVVPVKAPPAK